MDTPTPRSSKSTAFVSTRPARTPLLRTPQANSPSMSKYSRARASGGISPFNLPLKDDDSLTSCPPFSVPNYMTPTVSAKAKTRANSNPKERFPGTPSSEKRRLSFPSHTRHRIFQVEQRLLLHQQGFKLAEGFREASVTSIHRRPECGFNRLDAGYGWTTAI
ncbi:hypothetical protein OIU77_004778 [Salix suchowensis]|uniref:DUF4005 domain-containing protein n=1 Tax=Salix suchowensis TaxID=1278906 RepID=A0ABQ9AVI4_9ROSI|nr:hypothetical protein OIU77_004778 [Salix suchowensis]